MPPLPFPARRALRIACAGLLIAGLLAAAAILFASSTRGDKVAGTTLPGYSTRLDDNRRELAEVERLGGKASVLTVEFHQWFLSIWQGRRLAYTLVVLAAASAWLCWHISELVDEDHEIDPQ